MQEKRRDGIAMLGALVGDVVGSRFEFKDFKSREFRLFAPDCKPTDDSLMTLAVAKGLLISKGDESVLWDNTARFMRQIATLHPKSGWGGRFYLWVFGHTDKPNDSFGNGAGMRISPVGWVADSEEEVKRLSRIITEYTHGHPEGILGAEAVAMAVYLARIGTDKEEIHRRMVTDYYPEIDTFTIDSIRPVYEIDYEGSWVTCRGSIPQAIRAFLEADDFESAIRNAISIGGDADTVACMAGAIAEAYYGVPEWIEEALLGYLSNDLLSIYYAFNSIKRPRLGRA